MLAEPVPKPGTAVIFRHRLIDLLRRRFHVRLTIVVGGGGSGKTTALAQSITTESEFTDVWYACSTADRDRDRFLSGLIGAASAALGHTVDSESATNTEALAGVLLNASPTQVCVVLDDVHTVGRSELFDELIKVLPTNAHLLLAGRTRPSINTARLDAAGQLDVIEPGDLLMTRAELVDFANLRGVDIDLLDGAEGWPAFVELASRGTSAKSRHYLHEEAAGDLAPDHRLALAKFAFIGGGDDEIAQAAAGLPLDRLVGGLPLVRWTNEWARPHDLWAELLSAELGGAEQEAAALAASAIQRSRGEFDAAIDLAVLVGDELDIAQTLRSACRTAVEGGFTSAQLRRWFAFLPAATQGSPIGQMVAALIAREQDPTSADTREGFDRAAVGFAEEGDSEMEFLALTQLGYVSRISESVADIRAVMDRIDQAAEGYPPAKAFLPFGDAWIALANGRPDLQLEAMNRVPDHDLPELFCLTRDHLKANALNALGRPDEGLKVVPRHMDRLPVGIPGALVTESQARWFGGQPDVARASGVMGMEPRFGARDRQIGAMWSATMAGFAGDSGAMRHYLEVSRSMFGQASGPSQDMQQAGLEVFLKLVEGDEEAAAAELSVALEYAPLGTGTTEQILRNLNPLPYVLVPESREFWEAARLGPQPTRARDMARAFVSARAGNANPLAKVAWPDPGAIAATFPVSWAIELALLGIVAGRNEGRALAAWLAENWGEPARTALRSWVGNQRLGPVASDVLARTPSPPVQRIEVTVLGQSGLAHDGYATPDPNWRRERVRALLLLLVVNRTSTRSQLAGTLWPDLPTEKAGKNLRTTLSYLNNLLEPGRASGDATWFVRVDGQRVALHEDLDVDLRKFVRLLDGADMAERAGRPGDALPLLLEATALWGGDLAVDLDYSWLDLERIHVRSRFVRASCRAAELLVAMNRATEAIEAVKPALGVDPWHERSYHALAAAYDALGDQSSAQAIRAKAEAQLVV